MTLKEVGQLLQKIDGYYPNRMKLNKEVAEDWHRVINHQDFKETVLKLDEHIKISKFPPTVSELYIRPKSKVLTASNIFGDY